MPFFWERLGTPTYPPPPHSPRWACLGSCKAARKVLAGQVSGLLLTVPVLLETGVVRAEKFSMGGAQRKTFGEVFSHSSLLRTLKTQKLNF